jgi:hypothetical protein
VSGRSTTTAATSLMEHRIDLITILHVKLIGSLLSTKTTPIKQESNGVHVHRLPVTVSIHQLLELSASLDPKENLVSIL